MYQVGDFVVYGKSGVCKVEDVAALDTSWNDSKRLYYTLQPVYHQEKIFTPVDTANFIRPVISDVEAKQLIADIPAISPEKIEMSDIRMWEGFYKRCIDTQECTNLLLMLKTVYLKKKQTEQIGKKFGQIDERFMSMAEDLLYGEFSVVLDMPKDSVKEYVASYFERNVQ